MRVSRFSPASTRNTNLVSRNSMSNFVDYVKIHCKSGHGGAGSAHLRREKYIPKGGPDGGDGGRGGSVIMKGNSHEWTLLPLRYTRHIKAERGENGAKNQLTGAAGEDVYIEVPIGTIAKNEDGEIIGEILEDGQEIVLMQGGKGGLGNEHFKSSTNQTPRYAQPGLPGEEGFVTFELKLLADVGLVGFPSVGKSTILSVVTAAKPKIGAYHFTTIVPNLGMVRTKSGESFAMADLPGLIEGASQGVGLGTQFLRHIERTRVILPVIDMSASEGRDPYEDYLQINKELETYNLRLMERPQIIVANKMDMPGAEENLKEFKEKLAANYDEFDELPQIFPISSLAHQGLENLLEATAELLDETDEFLLYSEDDMEQEEVYYGFNEDERPFEISRDDDASWVLSGEKLEKLFVMTNMERDESIMKFARQLRGMGVDEALRERGAKDGDIVRIGNFEFEFVD